MRGWVVLTVAVLAVASAASSLIAKKLPVRVGGACSVFARLVRPFILKRPIEPPTAIGVLEWLLHVTMVPVSALSRERVAYFSTVQPKRSLA